MLLRNNFFSKFNINLFIVIAIAALLRLPFLATIPNGFFIDEAANGYEAYAILKTQHDSYGVFMPLFLRAMDDYRTALYAYITIPFIQIFGLNEFATRLPSALIGILTVFVLYLLGKTIFNQQIALVAALLLAISPCHVQFSRIAFEAIIFTLLFCLGLLCFIKSLRQANYLILSASIFGLSLCTYFSARIFVPLFIVCLVIIYRNHLRKMRTQTIIASAIFIIVFVLLLQFSLSPAGMARAKAVGITTNLVEFLQNYFSYFSQNFLFLHGDPNLRHSTQKLGELHLFEIITVLTGIILIVKQRRKEHQLLLCWLVLYPIPAAFTQPEHAIRSIIGAPLFAIISAYGFSQIANLISYSYKKYFKFIAILIVILSIIWFGKNYFVEYPKYSTDEWLFGMREAITYAENSSNSCAIASSRIANGISITYFILFYTQYPPEVYQRSPIPVSTQNYSLGKYHVAFAPQDRDTPDNLGQQLLSLWKQQLNDKCLFLIKPDEIKQIAAARYNLHQVHSIRNPYGVEIIKLIEVSRRA